MLQCILADLPSWIQALAALGLVALTGTTLIVLKDYAADTKTIARSSVVQLENSQMPFLAVAMRERFDNEPGGWVIENQGFGPAINVSYSSYADGIRFMRPIPPLAPREIRRSLHNEIAEALRHGFEIQYESLSGLKYRTTVTVENGRQQTQFHKP